VSVADVLAGAGPARLAGSAPVLVIGHAADPADHGDPAVRDVAALLWQLLHERSRFVAYCLGHLVLSELLGFELVRRAPRADGSCDGFAAVARQRRIRSLLLGGMIEVTVDPRTGEVHALRGPCFLSVAGHPGE
jgi:2-amino-4-deoxychorismate synthase